MSSSINGFRKLFISISTFKHLLHFSTLVTTKNRSPHFIIDYLINSIGFSMEEAMSTSQKLKHIRSFKNPDSVLGFFKQCGLNDIQIRYLISFTPKLLSSCVEKTLKPKLRVFEELGLSKSDLVDIMVSDPCLFTRGLNTHINPSIGFLQSVLGSNENVIKVIKKSKWLVSCNAQKRVQPNVLFLKKCGLSDQRIQKFILRNPRCFLNKPTWLERVIGRVEGEFGIPREHGMFTYAIEAIGSVSKSKLELKWKIFESFGWSKHEILTMIQNLPLCLNASEAKIHRGLEFYMKELGLLPSYIASRPKLLLHSLDKRVIPRYTFVKVLKERDLIKTSPSLYSILCLQEPMFLKNFVLKHKDKAPDIYATYIQTMRTETEPSEEVQVEGMAIKMTYKLKDSKA